MDRRRKKAKALDGLAGISQILISSQRHSIQGLIADCLSPPPPPPLQVQVLKGAIRVFCRIRPPGRTGDQGASCVEVGEEGELAVHDLVGQQECKVFRFDKIFGPHSSQSDVYEDTQPLIRSVLDGGFVGVIGQCGVKGKGGQMTKGH